MDVAAMCGSSEGGGVERGYLSHGSGPPVKNGDAVAVAVHENRRLKSAF
jgi:hypothetical protein